MYLNNIKIISDTVLYIYICFVHLVELYRIMKLNQNIKVLFLRKLSKFDCLQFSDKKMLF